MATSSAMSTSNQYIKYKITVTQNSQSIANNTSNVTVSVKFYRTNTGYTSYGTGTVYCKINGTTYTASVTPSQKITNSGIVLFTKTLNISHSTDGTKKLTCSAWIKHDVVTSSEQSYSQTLTTIPRKSTLSVANGTLNTAQTLTVTRISSSFTHTITATCGSASTTICSKSSSTSIPFTPPLAWASQNTTGTSVSVTYKITTYNGSTSIGSNSYTKTCSIPSSVKPSCKITVSESTSYGAYVKGLSKLKIVVTPTTSYGSAIASYSTSANGTTYTTASFTTGALSKVGWMTITAKVTDKRGRSGTATTEIYVADKSTLIVSNGTLGTEQTVSLDLGHTSFKHKITYTCVEKSDYIAGSSSTFTEESADGWLWTPPLSLATENTSGTSVSVTIRAITYTSNGTKVGEVSKDITCTMPSSIKPSCSLSVTDSLGYADKYGGYVKGFSKFKVVVTPTLAYDSAIASYSTTANGATYTSASFTTGALASSGTLNVNATVKDKRGRTGTASKALTVLNYAVPKVSKLTVGRCNEDGTANDKGAFAKVTFSGTVTSLNSKNSATYKLQYRKTTASSYTTVTLSDYANQYSVSNKTYIFAAETGSSYDVQLAITDDLKTTTQKTSVSTAFTLMHFSAGGTGMGIGKVAEEEELLDVGVPICLREGIVQNVLWSGAMYMTDAHTISLSQKVSKQAAGIALIFSSYNGESANDYHFNCFFVPKTQIKTHAGLGHTFFLCNNNTFGTVGSKYLYISDDKIVGNANNTASGTSECGLTYNNKYFVLRYVIGV